MAYLEIRLLNDYKIDHIQWQTGKEPNSAEPFKQQINPINQNGAYILCNLLANDFQTGCSLYEHFFQ